MCLYTPFLSAGPDGVHLASRGEGPLGTASSAPPGRLREPEERTEARETQVGGRARFKSVGVTEQKVQYV